MSDLRPGGVHGDARAVHAVRRGLRAVLLGDGPALVPRRRRVPPAAGAGAARRAPAARARR